MFESKSQARAMFAKSERGEIPKKTVEEFAKKTDFSKLPERKKINDKAYEMSLKRG